MVTINYTQTKVNAAITPAELAFVPPPTAQEREATAGNPMDLVGKRAPHFRLTKQDGGEVTDASLRGGAYVLVFWASWSDPSVSELPGLDDIYLKNITSAIKFFAVNQAEEAAAVKAFLSKSHITMPVLLDPEGKADIAFAAESLPEIVIVGRDGVVKKVFVGPDHQPDITAAIDALPGNAAAQPNP
jgi:peroxiredoxin